MTKEQQQKPLSPFELFGVEVNKGWWPLVKPVYDRIRELNAEGADIKITQIKEKYGQLCIYVHNAPDEVNRMIRKAEEKSIHICENCGAPAERVIGNGTWVYTLCADCLKKQGLKTIETLEEAERRLKDFQKDFEGPKK